MDIHVVRKWSKMDILASYFLHSYDKDARESETRKTFEIH